MLDWSNYFSKVPNSRAAEIVIGYAKVKAQEALLGNGDESARS